MFFPVSSVNCSIAPTPGTVSCTWADACVSTLMKVLRVKALPPQVPARPVCVCRIWIRGRLDVATPGPLLEGPGGEVPAPAMATVAHSRPRPPQHAFNAAALMRN
jgi:hypothetical protein